MRKVRGRGGEGPLVVRRGFVRSRYEPQFAAAAYALVAPADRRRLSVGGVQVLQPKGGSLGVPALIRRLA